MLDECDIASTECDIASTESSGGMAPAIKAFRKISLTNGMFATRVTNDEFVVGRHLVLVDVSC